MATDPVCGMFVEEGPDALVLVRDNRTYYFCCSGCRDAFAHPEAERRRLAGRLAVAWPLAIAVVLLTYAVPSRGATGIAAILAGAVQFYAGSSFYVGAGEAIRRRMGNMDLLIAAGTSAAYAYSVGALLMPGRLGGTYFFDASALIVVLILTGSYLEHLTRVRAGSALARLAELLPSRAHVLRDGSERSVPVPELRVGERVRVPPGGRFPADGTIRAGRTSVDEAILTGESGTVPRGPGDPVLAGAVNGEGVVEIEVARVGADTFVAQIGALLSEAEMSRIPLKRTADRIAAGFVPLVFAVALVAAAFWRFVEGASLSEALLVFVTVTITACPCAFGVATPAAILVGTGRAAEDGILFRGADAIERTARVDLVLTDKTGTLTGVRPEVRALAALPPTGAVELLGCAYGLSGPTGHPLGEAIRREAALRGVAAIPFANAVVDPGRGVRASGPGGSAAILRGDVARAEGYDLGPIAEWIRRAEERGESWSAVVRDGRLLGGLSFDAPIVPGAREAVGALRAGGIEIAIASGDNERAVRRVAAELGISEVHAAQTPGAKVALVERYRRAGRTVAFVGDGINDAPALAAADVGFAIGTGSEVARESGQVLLVRPDFRAVPGAIGWARRVVGRVRGNLAWALAYNAVLIPVAAGALVPVWGLSVYRWLPVAGALAMGLSSATVVLNSLTLRRPLPAPRAAGPAPRQSVRRASG